MIHVRCTHCGQMLQIDAGFAGGVCRCRFCGTIQTVPGAAAATGAAVRRSTPGIGGRPLYRREEERLDEPSGLDELAGAVHSSGALGSGMHRHLHGSSHAPHPARRPFDRTLALAVGAAALLAVAAAGLAMLFLSAADPSTGQAGQETSLEPPHFAGLPLGQRVVFLIDRGTQSQASFTAANAAVLRSLRRMPATNQFQVIYWADAAVTGPATGESVIALPDRTPRPASAPTLRATERAMREVPTGGTTDLGPALDLALRGHPDTLVILTAKGWQLPADFGEAVQGRTRDVAAPPVIHTVALGESADTAGGPLEQVATTHGGRFIGLSPMQLKDLGSR